MWLMNIFSYFILFLPMYINCEVSLNKLILTWYSRKVYSENQGCHLKGKTFIVKLQENNTKGVGTLNFKNHLFNKNIKFNSKEFPIKNTPQCKGLEHSTCIYYQKSEIL